MKKYILISIGILITLAAWSQNQKWEVYIGSNSQDEVPEMVIESYDKGYVVAGSTYLDAYFAKTNTNGIVLHEHHTTHHYIPGIANWAVTEDFNGNLYLGGLACIDNNCYPYVSKIDSCGNAVWCRYFPKPECIGGGSVWDLLINNNNELIVLMSYSSDDTADQIYLASIDNNGEVLWEKPFATKKNYPLMIGPVGIDLLQHNDEYYIAGDCYYPYPGNPNHVYLRPLFIGIDSNFNEKWVRPFHILDSVYGTAWAAIALNDSIIVVAGSRLGSYNEDANSILMFYTTSGDELGFNQVRNNQIGPDVHSNFIHDIELVNDTLLIAAVPYGPNSGINPIGDLIIDTACNVYRTKSHPNTSRMPRMTKTHDGNFVVCTSVRENGASSSDILLYKINQNLESVPLDTTQRVYDSLCPHTIPSGPMDLTDCLLVTSMDEISTPDQYYESIRWIPITAYPNPVKNGKLTLEFQNTKHHQNMELRCYDNFGRQIHSQKVYKAQQDTDLDVTGWSKGVYVAVIYSNGGARGKVKFVVE